jgi:hypothetical protein
VGVCQFFRYLFKETNSIKLITAEEEVNLVVRIKKGDTVALEELL